MAKYHDLGIAPAAFIADTDLSNPNTHQWHLVEAASLADKVAISTGASNPFPLGVLVNSPSAGQEAAVVIMGPTKAMVRANACDLIIGRFLTPASNAVLEPIALGSCPIFARYLGPTKTTAGGSLLADVLVLATVPGSVSGS